MNEVTEITDEHGATMRIDIIPVPGAGAVITVSDETSAAIVLNDEQARHLVNTLIDAGF